MNTPFPRLATDRLRQLAAQFPAVLILGARQVGKTTLARMAFPDHAYVDLEAPHPRELFTADPAFQIASRAAGGLILDEAQSVPEVFAALRGSIDADRQTRGRFVVLGSVQPALVHGVAESLAGRVGILELDPLTVAETTSTAQATLPWQRLWLAGGFPDALGGDFRAWQEAYLRTYIERDLPQLGLPAEPLFARRLLTMLAHQQGGLLNVSALAGALGVSHGRVARALDVFEQTFLLRRLPPFFRNVGKRLTKSPKAYLRDTGLLHHLLNIGSLDELDAHPVRGASWETFVIEDLLRRERLAHPYGQAFFWRTAAGAEIDLLCQRGEKTHAIEIKAGIGTARQARSLGDALDDSGAVAGWIIDQGEGEEALNPRVWRRGYPGDFRWLPA